MPERRALELHDLVRAIGESVASPHGATRSPSPLRYPGGKARALKTLLPLVPDFREFREPMMGGGSLTLALSQMFPERTFWGNDFNFDVFAFWKTLSDEPILLLERIWEHQTRDLSGPDLYRRLRELEPKTPLDAAVRFFVMNRITFSGIMDAGGYSQQAFDLRFTRSSISRLAAAAGLMTRVSMTNLDYEFLLDAPGEDVFIYLDPPYIAATKSRLYGSRGELHTNFDHSRFVQRVIACSHKWLLTYDNSEEVRSLFQGVPGIFIYPWEQYYAMSAHSKSTRSIGRELIITNFSLTRES